MGTGKDRSLLLVRRHKQLPWRMSTGINNGLSTRWLLPCPNDRALTTKFSSLRAAEASGNSGGAGLGRGIGGMTGLSIGETARMVGPASGGPDMASNVRNTGYGSQVPLDPMVRSNHEMPLPPDASCTLFVEGLPHDSTQREVAHIFRPFLGYKELRLVNKEPKYKGGGPLILCFVDFTTPGCAAAALDAVQGYKFDEEDPEAPILQVQFARFPTRKSGPLWNKR